jgi:hypothetical protein
MIFILIYRTNYVLYINLNFQSDQTISLIIINLQKYQYFL